jgi:hypothetical protein
MTKDLIHERYVGLAAASALLIVGLISLSSFIAQIPASGLVVEPRDGLLQRAQSETDTRPVALRVSPSDPRGLLLYVLMEATRARSH